MPASWAFGKVSFVRVNIFDHCNKYLLCHARDVLNLLLQAKPVNERLRHIGGTAKLVLDILEFDAAYERAFLSICG